MMLSDLGTRRYRLYLLIRFKKSPKPVSRFQIFKFSRFSNLDNLTLEISAFHPAFDPTLETLIHLTSLTPIPDCDVIMTSLRHIYNV